MTFGFARLTRFAVIVTVTGSVSNVPQVFAAPIERRQSQRIRGKRSPGIDQDGRRMGVEVRKHPERDGETEGTPHAHLSSRGSCARHNRLLLLGEAPLTHR